MKDRTVIIFCIGRELLEGQVLDRNANFMASNLATLGFRVRSIVVLDDVEPEVVSAFQWAIEQKPAYILTTGGLGPGRHDITRESAAKAARVPLVHDSQAEKYLAASYRRLVAKGIVDDDALTDERLKMVQLPEGSTCFENNSGTAPAVSFVAGESRFFLLPGAPEELRRMFTGWVLPTLEKHGPGDYREVIHIEYASGDESLISRLLGDLARRHPTVTTRARMQGSEETLTIRITLSVEGSEPAALKAQLEAASADIRARLGLEVVRTDDGESFAE